MKKILSVLFLLIFCFVQATWAGDVIIIGSDGQARFEDENKKFFPVTTEIIKKTTKILQEITITSASGLIKIIYVDKNGKIQKTEETKIDKNNITPIDKSLDKEFQNYISNAPKILMNTRRIIRSNGYKYKDNSFKNKKAYVKMNLLDGDYALGYENTDYIAEYHKNGELMGLIKREDIVALDNKVISAFYEYRIGYNTEDDEAEEDDMGLKHILFLDMEKDKYIAQYIYLHDGTLLCRQINNDFYVSEEGRNLIPDWSKKISNKTEIQLNKYEKDTRKTFRNLFIIATYPTWIVPPVGLVFFSIGNVIGGKNAIKKD